MWYGDQSFFKWLERKPTRCMYEYFFRNTAVILFAANATVLECEGKQSSGNGKIYTPELYSKTMRELLSILPKAKNNSRAKDSIALEGIRTRLGYLNEVGLSYLTPR